MAEGLKPTDKDLLPPKAPGLSTGSIDLLPPSDAEETFVPAALQAIEAGGAEQLGALGQIKLGFGVTALAGGIRRGQDERIAAQETFDETNPDATQIERIGGGIGGALKGLIGFSHDSGEVWTTKEDDIEGLIEGIPRGMHKDIMDAPTEEAAIRARARILEDLDEQMITSQQYEGGGLRLISSFLDVDAPLTVMSGGMIGAAKLARTAALVSKNKRVQGALQLGAGGAQAGAIVGAYDVAIRETSDESTFIASTIGGMAFGGTIGTLTGPMAKSINDLEIDYAQRVETSDPSLVATGEVPPVVTPTVAPPSAAGVKGPVLIIKDTPAKADSTAKDGIEVESDAITVDTPQNVEFRNVVSAANERVEIAGVQTKDAEQWTLADETAQEIGKSNSLPKVQSWLESNGFVGLKRIGGGRAKVVLSGDGDTVIRIGKASELPLYSTYDGVLKPTQSGIIGDLYVEVMPKVKMNLTKRQIMAFDKKVTAAGYTWIDNNVDNLGRAADGSIKIIDGEAFPTKQARLGGAAFGLPAPRTGTGLWRDLSDDLAVIPELNKAGPQSVGAAQSADAAPAFKTTEVEDPHGETSPTTQGWHDLAETSNYEAGLDVRKREDADKAWTKALNSAWNVAVGAGFQAKMYTSKSAVMNWMGRTVYESASGLNRGSATAAAMMEIYHKKIAMQLLPVRQAMHDWAQTTNNGAFGGKYGISEAGKAQYNREVMLERNARQRRAANGDTTSTRADVDPNITRGADAYDSAARDSLAIGKGRDGEHSVLGMEDVADNVHYTPQNWSGSKIANLIRNGRVRRENVVAALAQSYREAGMAVGKDADAVAEAVIRRSQTKDAQIDTSVHSLLQADGQEFLRDSLGTSGMSTVEIDGLMQRLVGAQKERGKEGFAKSRNEVDMSTSILTENGPELQIVDLLSNDLAGDWQRYARRMAGSAALARQGITSRAARKEITSAIHAEQRAAGEELTDPREIEAMFTNFDGGAVKGFDGLGEGVVASAGPAVALAKRGVQLAWLNQLGLTQLGETGALLWQNGLMTSLNRSGLNFLRTELKAGNKALLDDVKFLTGEIGQDQHLFAEHLNLDEVDAGDRSDLITKLQSGTSKMAFVQGFTSLFNSVRAIQQKTAALGTTDKIMRTLREELQTGELMPQKTKDRMWSEFGLDQNALDRLSAKIEDGTIEFSPEGFVNRLNADKWDGDLQDIVGAGITRNINQLIQKSMAGEQDAWMHTGFGAVLSHLKTFPLQATHKQLARHFRHNDPEAYGALAAGMITAGAVSVIRGALNGDLEELTAKDHAKRAFAYSNMTGFIPMATDPLTTMLGLDDLRFNQYSKNSEIAPPILSWANDAIRLTGALGAAARGTADYDDRKALRTLPFANTLLIGEMLTTIGQKGKPTKAAKTPTRKYGSGTSSETPPPGLTWDDLDGSVGGSYFSDGTKYIPPAFNK